MRLSFTLLNFFSILFLFVGSQLINAQSVKVSTFGYQSANATSALQKAMESNYDTLVIDRQSADWLIGPLRFYNIKNKVVIFEKGVRLQAKQGYFPQKKDGLLSFWYSSNIQFIGNGATLQMNKEEYVDGEWRHGISLRSCTDIHIKDLIICDTGGDGIFLDGKTKDEYSENIFIKNVVLKNNRRQGMTIVSAKNVKVIGCIFEDTEGTLPGAGVDLEPDHKENRIQNINFEECVFKNNDHAGIVLALHNLDITSSPISVRFSECLLENNHNKSNKYIASEITFAANSASPVQGEVIIENCIIQNSKWGFFYSRKVSNAYSVLFKDCVARNICLDESYPAMYLEVPNYYKGNFSLGGFSFENLLVEYETNVPLLMVRGSHLGTLDEVAKIQGDITVSSTRPKEVEYINYDPSANVNFNLDIDYQSRLLSDPQHRK